MEWDSAHRVMRHESKCSTLHGHRYRAEITVAAETLDRVDRVVDFGAIKAKVGRWIDEHWDHTTLVNAADESLLNFCLRECTELAKRAPYVFDGEPTAENIALRLFDVADILLEDDRLSIVRVRVYETPNCYAEVHW